MSQMFCFQCEQTARGQGCTVSGVCGKGPSTAHAQDALTGALVGLARAAGAAPNDGVDEIITLGLFTTVTNVAFDDAAIEAQTQAAAQAARRLGDYAPMDMDDLWKCDEDIRSLKTLLLLGLRGMAAYAWHARALGLIDPQVNAFLRQGLVTLAQDLPAGELTERVLALGQANLQCMALLDKANTGAYGTPEPTAVSTHVAPGPFIVISGHDLRDLSLLLEQTKDRGVNVYTHGEMLPAHAYPALKAYPHLKGNFGTAWQNQQKEFAKLPGAVLFTTNCLMPVRDSYRDRVFTTDAVSYPGLLHIGPEKDFTPVIERALALGGYGEEQVMTGINGGHTLTTGFGWGAVLSAADQVVGAVQSGELRRILLVGGCDGAKPGRNYYTQLVYSTPPDTLVLTLACGKYRFNDMDLGTVAGLPRLMDMGQCNDAYSAIRVAQALADAFQCGVNDLPLTLVLSWYEQKAVCVLLTLLALGVRGIYLGPTLPAFVSPGVLKVLVDEFDLRLISDPQSDLEQILS